MRTLGALLVFAVVWWAVAWYLIRRGKGTPRQYLGGFALALVALVAISVAFFYDDRPAYASKLAARTDTASLSGASRPEAGQGGPTLQLKPMEFADRFNRYMSDSNSVFRINKPVVRTGPQTDTFNAALNDRMYVVGAVDKGTGDVRSVSLMGSPEGELDGETLMVATAVLASAMPGTDIKAVSRELSELRRTSKGVDQVSARVLNNVKLFYIRTQATGVWFGAQAAL